MYDAVILGCGHEFSREELTKHFLKYDYCPKCGNVDLTDKVALRPSPTTSKSAMRFR